MPGHPSHALVHLALRPLALHPPAPPHQLVEEGFRGLEHRTCGLCVSSLGTALRDRVGQQLLDFTAAQQIVEDGARRLEATCFEEKIRQLGGAVRDRLLTCHLACRGASQLLLRLGHLVVILERGHLTKHGAKSGTLRDTQLHARLLRSGGSRQLLGRAPSRWHVRCAMRGSILFTLRRDGSRVHTALALGPQRNPAARAREEEFETAPFARVQQQLHTELSVLRQREAYGKVSPCVVHEGVVLVWCESRGCTSLSSISAYSTSLNCKCCHGSSARPLAGSHER
eukprot:909824-Prymnesium_polylepis.2